MRFCVIDFILNCSLPLFNLFINSLANAFGYKRPVLAIQCSAKERKKYSNFSEISYDCHVTIEVGTNMSLHDVCESFIPTVKFNILYLLKQFPIPLCMTSPSLLSRQSDSTFYTTLDAQIGRKYSRTYTYLNQFEKN